MKTSFSEKELMKMMNQVEKEGLFEKMDKMSDIQWKFVEAGFWVTVISILGSLYYVLTLAGERMGG